MFGRLRRFGSLVAVFTLAALVCALPAYADRQYRGGAVATAHPLATEAAVQMLDRGGNAVDAAVSAAFVLAVVGQYHSGLGGGGFALVHDAKANETNVLDFREVAPKAARRDMYLKDGKVVPGMSLDLGPSVAVPGAAAGYLDLLAKYGKLSPKVVLAPAIRVAKQGFWVGYTYQRLAQMRKDCLAKDPEASRLFLEKNLLGVPDVPKTGTVIRQPELAKTIELLAARGKRAFYTGRIAQAIVAAVQRTGGVMTLEDLATYQTRWRAPLQGTYRGHKILTMPPPSAGGLAVLQVLGVLEKKYPNALPWRDPEAVHVFAEAMKLAYLDRFQYLGDPGFVDVPLGKLTSQEHLNAIAARIDPKRVLSSEALLKSLEGASAPPVDETKPEKNTTHLSVIDEDGNAVAMTTTVNYAFGSCLVAPGTGVVLNDEMDDFATAPGVPNAYGLPGSEPNAIAPGKVPLSSMSPTLVFQKDHPERVLMAVGSPGGSTIPTTVMQIISNVIDHRMDITRAVGTRRVHHQFLPDTLNVERLALDPLTAEALKAKGHALNEMQFWGDGEAVLVNPVSGLRSASADPRNEGASSGQF